MWGHMMLAPSGDADNPTVDDRSAELAKMAAEFGIALSLQGAPVLDEKGGSLTVASCWKGWEQLALKKSRDIAPINADCDQLMQASSSQ